MESEYAPDEEQVLEENVDAFLVELEKSKYFVIYSGKDLVL